MQDPSSRQLIARCVDGGRDAQTLVMERYGTRLLQLARQGANNRARQIEPESVVTEVFLRFLELAQSGRLEWQFEGGLWRLLSRMTALRVKEKRREADDPRRTARGGLQSDESQNSLASSQTNDSLAATLDDFRELLGEYRKSRRHFRLLVGRRIVCGNRRNTSHDCSECPADYAVVPGRLESRNESPA
jgi:hypothetical protein